MIYPCDYDPDEGDSYWPDDMEGPCMNHLGYDDWSLIGNAGGVHDGTGFVGAEIALGESPCDE